MKSSAATHPRLAIGPQRRGAALTASLASRRRLKVIHVVDVLSLSGMECGVIRLLNGLDRDRFSGAIICLRFCADEARGLLHSGFPIFELGRRPGRDLGLAARLAAILRREGPDVVHSHNWTTLLYTIAAARLGGVPVVVHGEHGREASATPRRRLLLGRHLARRVDRVVAVSADLAEELRERWSLPPERLRFIANGVDLERFSATAPPASATLRREFGFEPRHRIALTVARLSPVKDLETLVRAFATVFGELPQARLLIVGGDRGSGARERLEQLANTLGIGAAIHFAGVRHDVPQLLALCDVYVNTSVYEGMSNTILEAMAARRPVVATRVGGTPALVGDGVSGRLVAARDAAAVAAALAPLLADAQRAAERGAAGRAHVERHHSMTAMLRAYGDLYEEATGRRELRRQRPARELVKRGLASALRWSGLNRLRDRVEGGRLSILTYHRVLPLHRARAYPFQGMALPTDVFEAQIAHLAAHYRVLSLADAVRALRHDAPTPHTVAVTFDDGYLDNYEYAWPILRKYGVPATFFVVSGAIDGSERLWWDVVADQIAQLSQAPRAKLAADAPPWLVELQRRVQRGDEPLRAAQDTVAALNDLPTPLRRQRLGDLAACCPDGTTAACGQMLGWEHLREMLDSGMAVGAHTVTHAVLADLSAEERRREIAGSVERLTQALRTPIHLFAYPRGNASEDLKPLLREAHIEAAVTTEAGCNAAGADPLTLRRIDAGYGNLRGGFDAALLDAEIRGWFAAPRRRAAVAAGRVREANRAGAAFPAPTRKQAIVR